MDASKGTKMWEKMAPVNKNVSFLGFEQNNCCSAKRGVPLLQRNEMGLLGGIIMGCSRDSFERKTNLDEIILISMKIFKILEIKNASFKLKTLSPNPEHNLKRFILGPY